MNIVLRGNRKKKEIQTESRGECDGEKAKKKPVAPTA